MNSWSSWSAAALEYGGGRELAYVKKSRAKECSTVYVVADSLGQAKEDLRRDWETDRRLGWVIDTAGPVTDPLSAEISPSVTRLMRDALRRGRLVAERDAILAIVPPDPSAHIRAAELQRGRLERDGDDLVAGRGRYRDHSVAHAIRELHQADVNIARLERNLAGRRSPCAQRKTWRTELADWRSNHATAARAVEILSAPERTRVDAVERGLEVRLSGLRAQRETHQRWRSSIRRHRVVSITSPSKSTPWTVGSAHSRSAHDRARVIEQRGVELDRGLEIDLQEGRARAPTRTCERHLPKPL